MSSPGSLMIRNCISCNTVAPSSIVVPQLLNCRSLLHFPENHCCRLLFQKEGGGMNFSFGAPGTTSSLFSTTYVFFLTCYLFFNVASIFAALPHLAQAYSTLALHLQPQQPLPPPSLAVHLQPLLQPQVTRNCTGEHWHFSSKGFAFNTGSSLWPTTTPATSTDLMNVKPSNITPKQAIQQISAYWGKDSPYCRFTVCCAPLCSASYQKLQHFFYNLVNPADVPKHVKPPIVNDKLWIQALKDNPDSSRFVNER